MTDPAAWNNRGNALLGLGRFDEAKDSFQQALDISGRTNVQNFDKVGFAYMVQTARKSINHILVVLVADVLIQELAKDLQLFYCPGRISAICFCWCEFSYCPI